MIRSKEFSRTHAVFLAFFSLSLTLSACGGENFKASPNRAKDQEKLKAEQSNALNNDSQAVTATLGQENPTPSTPPSGTQNSGNVSGDPSVGSAIGDQAPGWNEIKCAGNLFTGVFANELQGGMNLLGWEDKSTKPSDAGLKGGANLLDALADCVEADLKNLKTKGLQYVLVKFDPTTKTVTSAKPFNGPGVNQADYNQCAREAGATAARQSVASIAELLKNSRLAQHATCSETACCIDIK